MPQTILEDELEQIGAEYDQVVRADIEDFRDKAERVLRGEMTDDEFRQHRLRRGIYGQRQAGVQMVRTKIPGGTLTTGNPGPGGAGGVGGGKDVGADNSGFDGDPGTPGSKEQILQLSN